MDVVKHFTNQCCLVAPNARCRFYPCYWLYVKFACYHRVNTICQEEFSYRLEDMGIKLRGTPNDNLWLEGITVLPELRGK